MQEGGAGLTFSGMARLPMSMETGRCFRLLLMFASVSGSTLFCQQVTLARNPVPSEVTESLLWGGASEAPRGGGIDLDEVVLRISACDEEDLTDFSESRLTKGDVVLMKQTSLTVCRSENTRPNEDAGDLDDPWANQVRRFLLRRRRRDALYENRNSSLPSPFCFRKTAAKRERPAGSSGEARKIPLPAALSKRGAELRIFRSGPRSP